MSVVDSFRRKSRDIDVVDLHEGDFRSSYSRVLIPGIKQAKTPLNFVRFGLRVGARSYLLKLSRFHRIVTDGYVIMIAGPGVCDIEEARRRRGGG